MARPRARWDPLRVDDSRDPPLDDRGEPDAAVPAAGAPIASTASAALTIAPALAASRTLPLGVLSLLLVPGAGSSLWLSQSSLALFTGLLPLLIPAGFRSCALRPRKE